MEPSLPAADPGAVPPSQPAYEEISRKGCLELLARTSVGRVAGAVEGRPFIVPVNYVMDGEHVAFRTAPGMKLAAAAFDRVAFEIDALDAATETGWSVVVQGIASDRSEMLDDLSVRLRGSELTSWAPGEKTHWVAIEPESITGRRIRREI